MTSVHNNGSDNPHGQLKDELDNRDISDAESVRYYRISSHERNQFWLMRSKMLNLQSIVTQQRLMQR